MHIPTQADCDIFNDKLYKKIISTEFPTYPSFMDLSGSDIDHLHVDYYVGKLKDKVLVFMCTCKCGNKVLRTNKTLRKKKSYHSCGCVNPNYIADLETKISHGDSKKGQITHLYMIWCGMRYRCGSPNNQSYIRYGAKGIKVCDEWNNKENGYKNFKEWAYNKADPPYQDGLSIDRIDCDIGYCPENCRWLTQEEQHYNKRHTLYLIIGRYALPIAIWSKISGINKKYIVKRLSNGWSYEEAIFTPIKAERTKAPSLIYVPPEYDKFNKYDEFVRKGKIIECDAAFFKVKFLLQNNLKYYS